MSDVTDRLTITCETHNDAYHAAGETYIVRFWLPIIGPTATLLRWVLLDELASNGRLSGDGTLLYATVTFGELCKRVGVTYPKIIDNALRHGQRHGYWSRAGGVWLIPVAVPILAERLVNKQNGATGSFARRHAAYLAAMARA